MTSLFYEEKQWEQQTMLRLLVCINICFSLAVLVAWHLIGEYVAEPATIVAGGALSGHGRPELFEYPYVLLWSGPIVASFLGWCAFSMKRFSLARHICFYPIVLFALSYFWNTYFNQILMLESLFAAIDIPSPVNFF
ncbi:MAG: hypothetical protein GC150_06080 [Rhizobiales bacterium]|nr:hypothetical protein [Hyphomicrobiales bacterium]